MPSPPERWESIGLSGALAQLYAQSQKDFLPSLAILLEQAVPDGTTVLRRPIRLFSSDKRVEDVTVVLGDNVYTLKDAGDLKPLEAKRTKVVRGISLKTDFLSIHDWLNEVGAEVTRRATDSKEALAALRNFMEIRSI